MAIVIEIDGMSEERGVFFYETTVPRAPFTES